MLTNRYCDHLLYTLLEPLVHGMHRMCQVDRCRSMIRSWEGGASDEGEISEGGTLEENPLPRSAVAGEEGGVRDSAVCEGPLLSALLNKIETLLDQVCVCSLIPMPLLQEPVYVASYPCPSSKSLCM